MRPPARSAGRAASLSLPARQGRLLHNLLIYRDNFWVKEGNFAEVPLFPARVPLFQSRPTIAAVDSPGAIISIFQIHRVYFLSEKQIDYLELIRYKDCIIVDLIGKKKHNKEY